MNPTRHFIGWSRPGVRAVAEVLLAAGTAPADLDATLIVAPTRQAGRRLRETLAVLGADAGGAVLGARVVTPAFLLQSRLDESRLAPSAVVGAAWMQALKDAAPRHRRCLLPPSESARDATAALQSGLLVQSLRAALCDAGLTVADVRRRHGDALEESDRWEALEALEQRYLELLANLDLLDPCAARLRRAAAPDLPADIRDVIVACVPDLAPLAARALEALQTTRTVRILVAAPEDAAAAFDVWGRPLADAWTTLAPDVPDADRNLLMAASPAAQSRRLLEVLAAETDRYGPADIAIGVPDRSVIPPLESDLAAAGLAAFDPADQPVLDQPLGRLLQAFCDLACDDTYRHVRALLRQPDLLACLCPDDDADAPGAADLLRELDTFQNLYLPLSLADMQQRLALASPDAFPTLRRAVRRLDAWLRADDTLDAGTRCRRFLRDVCEKRTLDPAHPRQADRLAGAAELATALRELEHPALATLRLDTVSALRLLTTALARTACRRERPTGAIDLEGWVELSWTDAPLLIVTGMNEGFVPDSRLADVFLPDSLRTRLGLPGDAERLARDALLMRGMVEARRGDGRACFIAGKTGARGDPLRPSRLLFCCPDAALPARAQRLFRPLQELRRQQPAAIGFRLDPAAAAALGPVAPLDHLSATAFRDYLACPFRFYLKRVLRMEPLDDEKSGPDALDFGNLVHRVLQHMGSREDLWRCPDPETLGRRLAAEAERLTFERYGDDPALPVLIMLDAACRRLEAAAHVQARHAREGWEILRTEERHETLLGGLALRGIVDRVDRHAGSGRLLIVDYKTSDIAESPAAAHLAPARPDTPDYALAGEHNGKARQWTDLQLPVYRCLLESLAEGAPGMDVAYFQLPKATTHTALDIWHDLDAPLMQSARACMLAVVEHVVRGRFWPPAARAEHDEFAALFPAPPGTCIQPGPLAVDTKKGAG